MGTYWDGFIQEYKDRLIHTSTSKLLEAFWYYCNRFQKDEYMEECERIMESD